MTTIAFIITARILHVVSSTVWAGFVIIAGLVLVGVPRGMKAEGARNIRRSAVGRAARVIAPAAVVSLLSGSNLFSSLRRSARARQQKSRLELVRSPPCSPSSWVPSVAVPPSENWPSPDALGAPPPLETMRVEALNRRVILSAYATAGLLLISVTAMAAARFL